MDSLLTPIFYDDSSQKSILSWMDEKDATPGGPTSLLALAKQAGLSKIFFVSKSFHSFSTARKICEGAGIQLCFGLELWLTTQLEGTEGSVANESKVIVWMKNSGGYKDLIHLYNAIYTKPEHKYYHFRGSWDILKNHWTDNLLLTLPFFDSFVARNLLTFNASIFPDLPVAPILFREKNSGTLFQAVIDKAITEYNLANQLEEMAVKTIYYNKYLDVKAWMIYRTIFKRSTYGKPESEHCGSDRFCFEDYQKLLSA